MGSALSEPLGHLGDGLFFFFLLGTWGTTMKGRENTSCAHALQNFPCKRVVGTTVTEGMQGKGSEWESLQGCEIWSKSLASLSSVTDSTSECHCEGQVSKYIKSAQSSAWHRARAHLPNPYAWPPLGLCSAQRIQLYSAILPNEYEPLFPSFREWENESLERLSHPPKVIDLYIEIGD